MALATQADVESALGRFLTDAESRTIDTKLESASDLVTAYLGGVVADPVPPPVSRVVADIVVAILVKPAVTTADYQAGGYYQQREVTTIAVDAEGATTTGPWLTKAMRERLRPYRQSGARTAFEVDLTPPDGQWVWTDE